MDIEKVLFPKSDELVVDKDKVGRIQIVDGELDPINCSISEEGVIELDVSEYQYISLTYNNVLKLEECIEDMNDIYEEEEEK